MDQKLELETRMAWKEAGGRGVHAWEGASGGDKGCGLRRDGFSPSINTEGVMLYSWGPERAPWVKYYIFV